MSEERSEEQLKEINEEMASGALLAIQELLDSGGIPRGTFSDDQVRNLVALYNLRGEALHQIANGCEDPMDIAYKALHHAQTKE